MSANKIVLLAIAVVAVGIFALPGTLSLFSGQHSWYDLGKTTGNDVPCEKCHQDIEDEMVSGDNGVHKGLSAKKGEASCLCHRVTGTGVASGHNNSEGAAPKPGTTAHAAEAIACMICHENNTRTGGNYPFAGGFKNSTVYNGTGATECYNYSWGNKTGGEHAAHNDFINQAIKDPLMADSNEACIACHTRIGVNITWTKNKYLEFTAGEDPQGNWTIVDFAAGGTNITHSNTSNTWTKP
ncbi:MAG: hypothetical protein WAV32_10355 [Halobacteriota archaeon]